MKSFLFEKCLQEIFIGEIIIFLFRGSNTGSFTRSALQGVWESCVIFSWSLQIYQSRLFINMLIICATFCIIIKTLFIQNSRKRYIYNVMKLDWSIQGYLRPLNFYRLSSIFLKASHPTPEWRGGKYGACARGWGGGGVNDKWKEQRKSLWLWNTLIM